MTFHVTLEKLFKKVLSKFNIVEILIREPTKINFFEKLLIFFNLNISFIEQPIFEKFSKQTLQDLHIIGWFTLIWLFAPYKGQTNSKLFSQDNISSKKRTNTFDFTTWLVFVRFFGRKWRHQKYISKLTDLYLV